MRSCLSKFINENLSVLKLVSEDIHNNFVAYSLVESTGGPHCEAGNANLCILHQNVMQRMNNS